MNTIQRLKRTNKSIAVAGCALLCSFPAVSFADIGTAFTYQGVLELAGGRAGSSDVVDLADDQHGDRGESHDPLRHECRRFAQQLADALGGCRRGKCCRDRWQARLDGCAKGLYPLCQCRSLGRGLQVRKVWHSRPGYQAVALGKHSAHFDAPSQTLPLRRGETRSRASGGAFRGQSIARQWIFWFRGLVR